MRTLRKKLSFYVLGSLVTVAGFFAIIELSTRIVSGVRGDGFALALHELDATDAAINDIYQFHPFTGFTFKPNQEFPGGHPRQKELALIRTDAHGFLTGPERLTLQKGEDEIRIAMIGASTTANIWLNFEENWPGRLGEKIRHALPAKNVTVINAGVPGFNSAQSIGNLALRVMPFKPDLVIVYHGYNDLKVVRPEFEAKPDYSNVHTRPYGQYERPNWIIRLLNTSMSYVRARNAYREYKKATTNIDVLTSEIRLDRMPTSAEAVFEHNIRMLVACARAGGARVVLSSFATLHDISPGKGTESLSTMQHEELYSLARFMPGLSLDGVFDGISRYNLRLREISKEQNTGWVDNANLIAHEDENFVDRVHFSKVGAERMAENFFPVVLELLVDADASHEKPTVD